MRELRELVTTRLAPSDVAAVIIEPVLGEGGFIPAPRQFLAELREFCTQHGIVLIADEIQTGFARTGTLFACEQLQLEPDLITAAKGLGGGMPISAVTGRAEIMDAPLEGAIGGTYGGNPVSCAAALAVIRALEDGRVFARAEAIARRLGSRLEAWHGRFRAIGDIRGLGPMQAMELVKDRRTKEPDADTVKKLIQHCWENGLILMSSGTHGNVVRFLMPLTIEDAELDEGLSVIEAGLQKICVPA
jgi:4-aminobutyrate aminotransferase/(S)-3-amino-2-methylpropionate transaminase